jgi:hypothetical protein
LPVKVRQRAFGQARADGASEGKGH